MSDEGMQQLATELNVPVTAFIHHGFEQPYSIRYFTVTTEIPACGHATLAAAGIMMKINGSDAVSFLTASNILLYATSEDGVIMMRYPKYELRSVELDEGLKLALGISNYIDAGICSELEALFIETSPADLRTIQPDFSKLVQSNDEIKEVVITSVSDDVQYDYLLRSFCPWIGIDEDPVTGSVHCVLSGYWKERLNKERLKAYQASELGGEILVQAMDDATGIGGRMVCK